MADDWRRINAREILLSNELREIVTICDRRRYDVLMLSTVAAQCLLRFDFAWDVICRQSKADSLHFTCGDWSCNFRRAIKPSEYFHWSNVSALELLVWKYSFDERRACAGVRVSKFLSALLWFNFCSRIWSYIKWELLSRFVKMLNSRDRPIF